MLARFITSIVLCAAAVVSLVSTPVLAQHFHVGFNAGYEYGTPLPQVDGFEAYGKGRTSLYAVEAYVAIPIGMLSVRPTYSFGVAERTGVVKNLDGDYVPNGFAWSTPSSADTPGVLYSENYYDLSSEIDLVQQSAGAYVMLPLGGGLEVGSGYFVIQKDATVYSDVVYDQYYFDETSNGQDHFSYWDTYLDSVEIQESTSISTAIPLVISWQSGGGGYTSGTQLAIWRTEFGRSISLKYSVGFGL